LRAINSPPVLTMITHCVEYGMRPWSCQ
jgi:hypothetical protein